MKPVSLAVLLLCVHTGAQAAVGVVLQDDFSQNNGWSQPDPRLSLAVDGGQLSLDSRDAKLGNGSITRPFPLGAVATYRVSLDIAVTRQEGEDAFAGVELNAPSGDSIGVQLSPKDQNVRVTYWRHDAWAKSILPWTLSKALKSGLGEINHVTVESKGGSFTVSVNDQVVGRTKVIDFSPTSVGLTGGGAFAARYDNLSITETGQDSRLARMVMLQPVPGQRLLAYDDFKSYAGAAKLMALTKKKKDKADWGEFWNNDKSRVEVDGARQRMVVESKSDRSAFTTLSSYFPLKYSGVSIHARLNFLKLAQEDDCGGVLVQGTREVEGYRDLMLACVSQTQSMLTYFDAKADKWQRLATGPLTVPVPSAADITLVINNDQVLMFVGGRLQISADRPATFDYYTSGVRVDPMQAMEVLEFKASEI